MMFSECSWVQSQLICRGFMKHDNCWTKHGEKESLNVAVNDEVSNVRNELDQDGFHHSTWPVLPVNFNHSCLDVLKERVHYACHASLRIKASWQRYRCLH
uniref:Uncharacterized protein n=1 Tax=Oryza barthii TaxID=65489 RepID=A0A0D3GGD0_9ORYZ